MTVPDIVRERLGDEEVGGRIPLGGEDELLVTRTQTLIYRGDGLLSGESVEEYPHEAERIDVKEGRRKSKIALDYGIDGAESIGVPSDRLSDALRAVFAGVLFAAGVIQPGETVERLYRRGELTLAITSARIVKHVGTDVWNHEEFEEFTFDDVTGLDVERGEVSSQIILEVDGRPQRIKTPSEDMREIRVNIERALLAHHEMDSYDEFEQAIAEEREAAAEDEPADEEDEPADAASVFDSELDLIGATSASMDSGAEEEPTGAAEPEGDPEPAAMEMEAEAGAAPEGGTMASAETRASTDVDADHGGDQADSSDADLGAGAIDEIGAEPTEAAEPQPEPEPEPPADDPDAEFEDAGFEPAEADTASELADLRRAVERTNELLEEQQRTIDRLIEELRRGR